MTRTRFVITSLVLLCLIAFMRNVHAQDATRMATPCADRAPPQE